MKKIIWLAVLLLSATSCKSQTKLNTVEIKKNTKMEYFDLNKFLKNNPKGNALEFVLNGERIQQYTDKRTEYIDNRININTGYRTYKNFFYKTRQLKIIGNSFYNCKEGIWREFNELGQPIKEVNYDKDYNFSILDLVKKMKEDYQIDILDSKNIFEIIRWIDVKNTKLALYEVYARDVNNESKLNCYIINGNTGQVLFTALRYIEGKQGSLYDDFLKKIKEKH